LSADQRSLRGTMMGGDRLARRGIIRATAALLMKVSLTRDNQASLPKR